MKSDALSGSCSVYFSRGADEPWEICGERFEDLVGSFRSIRRASGPLRAEMTRACSGIVASCSKSVLQASRADHGPQDLGVADVAVGAAECGLVGVDDGVGVQRVELAGREVVCMARRGQRNCGRWGLLLVAVVSHG